MVNGEEGSECGGAYAACADNAVDVLLSTCASFAFSAELLLAFVQGDKLHFGSFPCFVGRGFDFPGLHFLVIQHVR